MASSSVDSGITTEIGFEVHEERSSDTSDDEEPYDQLTIALQKETLVAVYKAVKDEGDKASLSLLTPTIFVNILRDRENIEPVRAMRLYEKIDWASLKEVTWSEFCTFMLTEFSTYDKRENKRKEVDFVTPVPFGEMPHRDPGIYVQTTPDGHWITVSEEATIAMWSADAVLKRYKLCVSKERMKKKNCRQWITDAQLMTEFSKIILTTGDREIQFFDMTSFTPFCQITGLESIPLCIDYKSLGFDRCIFIYGDEMGCISVLTFNCLGKSFRTWKKLHKHEDYIPSIPINQAIAEKGISFMRWHVHRDWVLMVRYRLETDQIISCSRDPNASLVIGHRRSSTNISKLRKADDRKGKRTAQMLYACTRQRYPQDQVVFSLLRGVKCFDFCCEQSLVATGGIDRMIRLWDCFLNREPIARLSGHYDVIQFLHLSYADHHLYSVSGDRWVKIWHTVDHTCLLTVPWHIHMVTGYLRSVSFSAINHSLAVLGDGLAILKLKKETEEGEQMTMTHKHPVNCMLYNPVFNHIISACEGSTVKTWNFNTGILEGEFVEAHGLHGVSDMALDGSGKKLITVARDGSGKMWNYNTGMCVRSLQPASEDQVPLTAVTYADMHNIKYILTAGWSHHLYRYIDDTPQTVPFQLPMLPPWRDVLTRGHTADILCCDYSQRDQAATGGFDGIVTVWNLETGYRFQRIVPPEPANWSKEKLKADCGVSCLHFLKLRSKQRKGGNLVVGGPYGHITMWNTNFASQDQVAMASFLASSKPMPDNDVVSVSAIDSDTEDQILATGDGNGRVSLWDISKYALYTTEKDPPPCLESWVAHRRCIHSIKLAKEGCFVVSCADYSLRLWTASGHYIGTFGQSGMWNVENEATYRYPKVPYDIREFHKYIDEGKQKEEKEDIELSEEDLKDRRIDLYESGLKYFARHKAVLSKTGRHMNDEWYDPYSPSGSVAPYHSLRQHMLQAPPHLPPKSAISEHLRKADGINTPELDDPG